MGQNNVIQHISPYLFSTEKFLKFSWVERDAGTPLNLFPVTAGISTRSECELISDYQLICCLSIFQLC